MINVALFGIMAKLKKTADKLRARYEVLKR